MRRARLACRTKGHETFTPNCWSCLTERLRFRGWLDGAPLQGDEEATLAGVRGDLFTIRYENERATRPERDISTPTVTQLDSEVTATSITLNLHQSPIDNLGPVAVSIVSPSEVEHRTIVVNLRHGEPSSIVIDDAQPTGARVEYLVSERRMGRAA